MGKKNRRNNRERNIDVEDSDDSVSVSSTADSFSNWHEEDAGPAFSELLDLLSERSAALRQRGLLSLNRLFRRSLVSESIWERNQETTLQYLFSIIRKWHGTVADHSSPPQAYIERNEALSLLNVICITFGEQANEVFDRLHTLPTSDLGEDGPALQALALTCFFGSADTRTVVPVMERLDTAVRPSTRDANRLLAALRGWSLLATLLPAARLADTEMRRFLPLLEHSSVDVRIAAGGCLALVWDAIIAAGHEPESELYEELLDVLHALSTDSSHSRSRKDKNAQKRFFRDVLHTVESNEPPQVRLDLRNEKISLTTWPLIVRCDALRDALGEGFQCHAERSDLVRGVLQLGAVVCYHDRAQLSQLQKRLLMSPNSAMSKDRTVWLRGQRSRRAERMHDDE